jgi:hypothetical protein
MVRWQFSVTQGRLMLQRLMAAAGETNDWAVTTKHAVGVPVVPQIRGLMRVCRLNEQMVQRRGARQVLRLPIHLSR